MRTEKSVKRRVRQWTRRPARAIPYGPFARLSDWRCASRDARAGAPETLAPADAHAAETPHIELGPQAEAAPGMTGWATPRTVFLGQLGRGRAEREWARYQAEVADLLIQLTQARAKRDSALRLLKIAEERLHHLADPTAEDLRAKVSGEEDTDEAVRAGRRMREFAERRRAVEAEVNQVRAAVTEHDVEIARLSEPVRIRFEVARTRAMMIDAYVRRRCAAYLTRLVHKHPDGHRIGPLIRSSWPERPSWAARELPPDIAPDVAPGIADASTAAFGSA
jgi:hypothetical protein